jgi:RimJ/RimL family protein N-acetyltransferase
LTGGRRIAAISLAPHDLPDSSSRSSDDYGCGSPAAEYALAVASLPPPPLGSRPDAGALEIRAVRADDKLDLVRGFEHLSDRSRYRRFLSPHARLSSAELRYFTEVDHHDHEALVAVDPRTGEGVGEARFIRSPEDPHAAELAMAVVDEWQGRGVGTRLASELARRAREEGITTFTALVLASNEAMLALARHLGRMRVLDRAHGAVEIAIELLEPGAG